MFWLRSAGGELDEKHLAECLDKWNAGKNGLGKAKLEHRRVQGKDNEFIAKIELSSPASIVQLSNHFFAGPKGNPPAIVRSHSPSLIPPAWS